MPCCPRPHYVLPRHTRTPPSRGRRAPPKPVPTRNDRQCPLPSQVLALPVAAGQVRGWWQLTEELVSVGREHGVDLSSTVHQTSAVIRKQLQALGETLQKPKVSVGYVVVVVVVSAWPHP